MSQRKLKIGDRVKIVCYIADREVRDYWRGITTTIVNINSYGNLVVDYPSYFGGKANFNEKSLQLIDPQLMLFDI